MATKIKLSLNLIQLDLLVIAAVNIGTCDDCIVYSACSSVWEWLASVLAALLKGHECSSVEYSYACDHLIF